MIDALTGKRYDTLSLTAPAPYVLTVALNRPERRNAFNTRMAEELVSVFGDVFEDQGETIRAAVLTGTGDKAFCAGADLKERHGMDEEAWRAQHEVFELMAAVIRNSRVPIVAAVEGAAFAGGFELMLSCAFAYASTASRFALTEVTLGIIPGIGGTQLLPRVAGPARAREIILTGRPFDADQALAWGIVNRLFEPGDVLPAAESAAAVMAGNAPLAVANAAASIRQGATLPLDDAIGGELRFYNQLVATEDRMEGISAFNEKRKPDFKGR